MKNKLLLLVLLLLPLVTFGQSGAAYDRKTNQYFANEFGMWTATLADCPRLAGAVSCSTGAGRTLTFTPQQYIVQGLNSFTPIANNIKVILDSDNSGAETVTLSSVNCPSGGTSCTAQATTTLAHARGAVVTTGTAGVNEAIYTATPTSGFVIINPLWPGITSYITNAFGNVNVMIIDFRAGSQTYYTWNGSNYTVVFSMGAGFGGAAPIGATYITQTPNATLSSEQALSLLATGLLKSTTGTGIVSIGAAGTDYENPLTFNSPITRATNTISCATCALTTTTLTASTGLTGGGDLSTNRTFAIDTAVVARKTDDLSVFASTTSAQLAGVISNETGSSLLVFNTSPTLVTPILGAASATSLTLTNQLTVANGGTSVTSLSDVLGTTNQITVTSGTARVIGGNVTLALTGPHNFTTLTTNGVLYGNSTSAVQATAQGASGSVLVGNAGVPSFSTTPTITTLTLTNPLAVASGGTAVASLSNILGTTNQVTVTGGTAAIIGGNATLSLPQNIHTGATPQFTRLGLGVAADANAPLIILAATNTLGTIQSKSATDLTNDYAQLQLIDNTAVAAGIGGMISFAGYYTGTTVREWAAIQGAKENATDSNYAGVIRFFTRTDGSAGFSAQERMRIASTGFVTPGADNTQDFGSSSLRWKTGYFGTSLGVGVTAPPATSAALEVNSTTGAVLIPRMTTTQRDALTPVNGMIIYNSTLGKFQGYEAGAWNNFSVL